MEQEATPQKMSTLSKVLVILIAAVMISAGFVDFDVLLSVMKEVLQNVSS